ncbi:MAG: hypothetical protein IAF38_01210, partial [Bacteroidia bacterium]|nr:hypothetical protein [Bacteroidia bacterium]
MIKFSGKFFLIIFLICCSSKFFSQNNCGTSPAPSYLLQEMNDNNSGRSVPTYTIPVVFHIYYDENSAVAPPGYLEIQRALDTLNMRFQKENSDTSLVYSGFKSIIGDAKMEFVLARKDESGNCISGIFYNYVNNQSVFATGTSNLNTNKYFNIHVVNNSFGAAGTGTYPTPWSVTPAANNQVIVLADGLFGFLLAHEAGHWLGLIHTFGNTNQTGVCGDDMVSDTPPSCGSMICDTLQSICNFPVVENINNYMDYSACKYMFTQGQVSRMTAILNDTTLSRREIWTAPNLAFTGVNPIPSCTTFSMSLIAQSNQFDACTFSNVIDFIANPFTVFPDSVKWIFPGGVPSVSTSATERVFFPVIGTVTVTLNAYYSGVTHTYTTTVSPNNYTTTGLSMKVNYPFVQDFENGFSVPGKDLYVIPGDTTWKIRNVGYNSDSCLFVAKESKLQTDTNKFVTGVYNFSNNFHPMLKFKVATSKGTSVIYRKLFVYLKNRCTGIERLMTIQYDSVLAMGNTVSNFVPSSNSQWKNVF